MRNTFCYFNSSPEVIRLTVLMRVRFPLSPRQVEGPLHGHGSDTRHEAVRYWTDSAMSS
jgi:putative transposase